MNDDNDFRVCHFDMARLATAFNKTDQTNKYMRALFKAERVC